MPARWKDFANHTLTKAVRPFNRMVDSSGHSVYVRGLTKTIKEVFCPKFKRVKKGGSKTSSSKRLGVRVHAQIEAWAKERLGGPKSPYKRLHTYTKDIIKYLEKHKLKPLGAEVPLLSPSGHFLTQSDLICKGSRGLIVVSLKTGYNRTFKQGKNLVFPHGGIKDSYYVQHQLQLALEMASLKYDYGQRVEKGIVLYVGFGSKKSTRVEPLAQWALVDQKALLNRMQRSVPAREKLKFPH